ncbi:MAG: hypothetical protein INF91_08910 [Alphaproteobacteria bacterium]|nr:hypothetical protein [Alphaproteobacteria bacterium]
MRQTLAVLALLAATPAVAGDAARLADRIAGLYDNAAQAEAAPAEVKAPPSVGGIWLDRQVARFVRVDAPLVSRDVLYLEWRSGGPDGPISRQRIWALRDTPDGVRMDYFTIAAPERFAGKADVAGAFAALTPAELTGYGEACAVRFTRVGRDWVGRVTPADCTITARSGRRMTLDVTIRAGRDALSYVEKGVLETGAVAFAVPSWRPYDFRRMPAR